MAPNEKKDSTINFIAIGKRISEFRKRRGLTQLSLSEIVGISPQSMSSIENGIRGMSLETFIGFANALNVSADDLLLDEITNTIKTTNHAFTALLSDTSEYEMRIMLTAASALKEALRYNRGYFSQHR